MDGFREIDHSGDIGIEAWGATARDVLKSATRGLASLMTWSAVELRVTRAITVESADAADVAVDWLSAVILCAATHGELYADADLERVDEHGASGVVRGEPLDPARHRLRFDVKAATYHDPVWEETPEGVHMRVIFDL